jgi:hypothetical protein
MISFVANDMRKKHCERHADTFCNQVGVPVGYLVQYLVLTVRYVLGVPTRHVNVTREASLVVRLSDAHISRNCTSY